MLFSKDVFVCYSLHVRGLSASQFLLSLHETSSDTGDFGENLLNFLQCLLTEDFTKSTINIYVLHFP